MTAQMVIADEVRALERLDLEALRMKWRQRIGPPPKVRSVELLRSCLAWRIQAAAFGGLSSTQRRALRAERTAGKDPVGPGTRIRREWRGAIYEVDRVVGGYRWNGTIYKSLTAAAQAITGVKRNGPRFFGLREDAV